jgi:hypothetical protein
VGAAALMRAAGSLPVRLGGSAPCTGKGSAAGGGGGGCVLGAVAAGAALEFSNYRKA